MKFIASIVLVACVAGCGASIVGPGPTGPCPPEHELDRGQCVYRGGYLIPSVGRDAGR
jgi:hypothetical protein